VSVKSVVVSVWWWYILTSTNSSFNPRANSAASTTTAAAPRPPHPPLPPHASHHRRKDQQLQERKDARPHRADDSLEGYVGLCSTMLDQRSNDFPPNPPHIILEQHPPQIPPAHPPTRPPTIALEAHAERVKRVHLRDLLQDASRNNALTVNAGGILFDYSRQNVTVEVRVRGDGVVGECVCLWGGMWLWGSVCGGGWRSCGVLVGLLVGWWRQWGWLVGWLVGWLADRLID
jgi:hypothetical protein